MLSQLVLPDSGKSSLAYRLAAFATLDRAPNPGIRTTMDGMMMSLKLLISTASYFRTPFDMASKVVVFCIVFATADVAHFV
jgi:hypothetical protein